MPGFIGGAVLEKPKTKNAYRNLKMAPELLSEGFGAGNFNAHPLLTALCLRTSSASL
jgi:hypothetical protein